MAISTVSLGKVKFNWKGDWTQSTAYVKDDVVKYGPNVYTCLTAHTSQATFAPDSAKWDLMVAGFENAGIWNSGTLYKVGQTVTYGGAVYIALQESTNQNPYTAAAYWQKFVDGQQFEGDYDNIVDYQKGDIITYGGYSYVSKQNSTGNLPTNTTYWDIYIKGYRDRGIFNTGTLYLPGDVVLWGGNKYIVKEGQPTSGNDPDSTTYWTKILNGITYRND